VRDDKVYTMLGLAQRAGGVASGEAAVAASLGRGKARLVILAHDASENTVRRFRSLAQQQNVPYVFFGTKESLGHAIGKAPRAALAVEDRRFAQTLRGLLTEGKLR
jgi:ribosomal protein L7Ae-like RNA K-turn-binding protein